MIFFVQQLKQENERNPTSPQDNPAHVLPWTNPTLQKVHQGRNSWIPLFPSEILGFLFSHSWPALKQSLLQGEALDFLCTAAQSHPSTWMASNPPFPVGQSSSGLRAGSDMGTGAEKGNPGEAEPLVPSGGFLFHSAPPAEGTDPQGLQQLQTFSSPSFPTGNSNAPSLLHPSRKENCREILWVQHLGSTWSIPCLPFPRGLVLAVPPVPRHRGIGGKLVFLKKKHSNSLCFPNHRGSSVRALFSSYFHRDVVS